MLEVQIYRLPTNNELRKELDTTVWIRAIEPGVYTVQVSAPGGFQENRGKYPAPDSIGFVSQVFWPQGESDVRGLVCKVFELYAHRTSFTSNIRDKLAGCLHNLRTSWLEQLFNRRGAIRGTVTSPLNLIRVLKQDTLTPFGDLAERKKTAYKEDADAILALLKEEI